MNVHLVWRWNNDVRDHYSHVHDWVVGVAGDEADALALADSYIAQQVAELGDQTLNLGGELINQARDHTHPWMLMIERRTLGEAGDIGEQVCYVDWHGQRLEEPPAYYHDEAA